MRVFVGFLGFGDNSGSRVQGLLGAVRFGNAILNGDSRGFRCFGRSGVSGIRGSRAEIVGLYGLEL